MLRLLFAAMSLAMLTACPDNILKCGDDKINEQIVATMSQYGCVGGMEPQMIRMEEKALPSIIIPFACEQGVVMLAFIHDKDGKLLEATDKTQKLGQCKAVVNGEEEVFNLRAFVAEQRTKKDLRAAGE